MTRMADAQPLLPYGFARRAGVLLRRQGGAAVCGFRPGAGIAALVEAQRVAGDALSFEAMAPEVFDAALAQIYRDSAATASDAASAGDDLAALADSAAVDDLLEQGDDAPVVRLINALLRLERGAQVIPSAVAQPSMAHMAIVNPLRAGGHGAASRFAGLFMTHPPVEARVAALQEYHNVAAR